jgi:tetratricopeptide (TPR) repeat protein
MKFQFNRGIHGPATMAPLPFTLIATMVLLLDGVPTVRQAQGADDPAALQRQVSRLHSRGMYADAIPLARRYVIMARQSYGDEHPKFGTAITLLADVYRAQGRIAEAEPLYQRALGPVLIRLADYSEQ